MATSNSCALLPNQSIYGITFPHKFILFVQLFSKAGNGNLHWQTRRLRFHVAFLLDMLRGGGFIRKCYGHHGSYDNDGSLRLVPTQSRYNSILLVWHPIQGHVSPLGAFCLQSHRRPRGCNRASGNPCRTSLLLSYVQVSSRFRRYLVHLNSSNFVQIFSKSKSHVWIWKHPSDNSSTGWRRPSSSKGRRRWFGGMVPG